jgi:hypothetical protein
MISRANPSQPTFVGRRFVIPFSSFAISLLCTFPLSPAHAKEGAIQCGMAIYAGTKTSRCFSDEFLSTVQQKTSISTERQARRR